MTGLERFVTALPAPLKAAVYYVALIVGDWLERHDAVPEPEWDRRGSLIRGPRKDQP